MFIVMHCGGLPFNGDTINTSSLGGSETAAYYVAKELAALGHEVAMFTNSQEEGDWDGVKYLWAGEILQDAPLGNRFHYYATNTPHDVCIIQRHPQAFTSKWASKINLLWLHDLAMFRTKPHMQQQMWNVDGILCVSKWHKKQLCDVYGFNPEIVFPITNGIDLALFDHDKSIRLQLGDPDHDETKLIYSSRPERGLEHLVRPGGIMERLQKDDIDIHLYVCNYANTTAEMRDYYAALYQRIDELPNCTLLGHLTKQQLADVMLQADALIYPTEFEEVSCITAMEAMAAGLPFISSQVGALPETCAGSGAILLPLKDGRADEGAFVRELLNGSWRNTDQQQLDAANKYAWANTACQIDNIISTKFHDAIKNPAKTIRHFIHLSDIYIADGLALKAGGEAIIEKKEIDKCYPFIFDGRFKEHYEAYYEYEKSRGVNYGPENLNGNTRYECVAGLLADLPAGSRVLDYGCAHGHYTVNLAKRFPQLQFTGVDLAQSNIDIARKWAADDQVENVIFWQGDYTNCEQPLNGIAGFHAIIAAEVLEHVAQPWALIDSVAAMLQPDGKMIITTPFGPWEAQGYKEHHPWRAHVHHFERADLRDMFGHHPQFTMVTAPSGHDPAKELLGSYIASFGKPQSASKQPDYVRKLRTTAPRETLSVCMIVKNGALTLARCLDSIKNIADEIIVCVDNTTSDDTREIAWAYGARTFDIESPMSIGFDAARNISIEYATSDWILWIDHDEVMDNAWSSKKYLRPNQFNGYSIKQHHFTIDPPGILKTDLPVRIFRNHKGIRFYGVVHEHPEITMNNGLGNVMLLAEAAIGDHGYQNEVIRRNRFRRNINLLVRDREKYPERLLGKFLWLRDLAQMCQYEAEGNGGQITPHMLQRAQMGIDIWEELIRTKQTRLCIDGLDFYSTLCRIIGDGFDYGFAVDASKLNGGAHPEKQPIISGHFRKLDHVRQLMDSIITERTENYESKYF